MLTVTLVAATASADPHSVPFEVIHVLPDTQQVLVLDKEHNTHKLLTVGSAVGDDVVIAIDGIGMTLEDANSDRFMVYPRAAQGLALALDKGTKSDLPAVFSTTEPTPAPVEIAALDEFAGELASLFFAHEAPVDAGATSALIVSLK